MAEDHAVVAEDLRVSFGATTALDGVSFSIARSTVLGLLGPNGAGKTTAVRVLTTLLRPDSGRAVVAGVDVLERPGAVRRRIGLAGQYAAVDENLTGGRTCGCSARSTGCAAAPTAAPTSCSSASTSPVPPTAS